MRSYLKNELKDKIDLSEWTDYSMKVRILSQYKCFGLSSLTNRHNRVHLCRRMVGIAVCFSVRQQRL